MKRTLLIALGLTFALGCIIVPDGLVYGNGTQTVRSRDVSDFHTINNHTGIPVRVREAPAYQVFTTLDSNLQDLLRVERHGDELRIDVVPSASIHPSGDGLVDIYLPSFLGASTSGSGSMSIDGVTGAKDLSLTTLGSGGITFDGTAHELDATTWGSGGITLSGSASLLVAVTHGSGGIDARDFQAGSVDMTTWGSGEIQVQVMGGEIRARIYGSGDIHYWGAGQMMLLDDLGSGSLYYHPY